MNALPVFQTWYSWLPELPFPGIFLVKITLLLCVGWLLHFILRRANPRWRVLLWRGVAVGFLFIPALPYLVPTIEVGIESAAPRSARKALSPESTSWPASEVPRSIDSPPLAEVPAHEFREPPPADVEPSETGVQVASTGRLPEKEASRWGSARCIPWLLWIVGTLVCMFRLFLGHYRVRLMVRNAPPAPEDAQAVLKRVADALGCKRRVDLRASREVATPFLTGLRRTVLIVPHWLTEESFRSDLRAVFAHELSHARSSDLFWGYGLHWLTALLWFHPLVWPVRSAHAAACEEVCDAISADFVGSSDGYSRTLARVAVGSASIPCRSAGIPMARRPQIARRLSILKRRILSRPLSRSRVTVFSIMGLLCVVILGGLRFVSAKTQERKPPESANSEISFVESSTGSEESKGDQRAMTSSPDEVTGIVTDERGNPRARVYFTTEFPNRVFRGDQSDEEGRFVLKGIQEGRTHWLAYHQPSRRMALFTVSDMSGDAPIRVVLNLHETEVMGRVVDPDGEGVAGAEVELRIETPDGETFVSARRPTGTSGYYEFDSAVPTGDDLSMRVYLESPFPSVASAQSARIGLADGLYYVDVPELVVDSALAQAIREHPSSRQPWEKGERVAYGGRVINEEAEPVAGARVELSYRTTHSPHGTMGRTAVTDETGRWRRLLPADVLDVQARVQHPDYISATLDANFESPPEPRMLDGTSVIVMRPGIPLRGRVRDETGKPINDAVVLADMFRLYTPSPYNEPTEDTTSARTDEDGTFVFRALPPGPRDLYAAASGYAPVSLSVPVAPNADPVEITLSEGGTIHGRIVDDAGSPIERAAIGAMDWHTGRRTPIMSVYAFSDSEGYFTVRNVPFDGVLGFNIWKRGFEVKSGERLVPRDEPYTIMLHPPLEVRGRVVDGETGNPITKFTVTSGSVYREGLRCWRHDTTREVRHPEGEFTASQGNVARVWAPGYYPEVTAQVRPGEEYEPFVLRLRKGGESRRGKVLDPDGKPLNGARVAWIGPDAGAHVSHGRLDQRFARTPDWIVETDREGRYELPPGEADGTLLVLHSTGYFIRASGEMGQEETLRLLPWARVEGTVYAGAQPQAGAKVRLELRSEEDDAGDAPIDWLFDEVSHIDGRYEFQMVPAMELIAGKLIVKSGNVDLSHGVAFTAQAGKTQVINIGAGGRSVTGRITLGSAEEESGADFLKEAFRPERIRALAKPVREGDKAAPGEAYRPVYAGVVEDDGRFRIDSLHAGEYELAVDLHAPRMWNTCGPGLRLARGEIRFNIPEAAEQSPIKIPDVILRAAPRPQSGDQAPPLQAKTLTGEPFSLADLRGKVVLLDFWATWCIPCLKEVPRLKTLWDRFAETGRLEIVGLNLDHDTERAKKFVDEKALPWKQVQAGDWKEDNPIMTSYGVGALPSFWLVSPDGRVVARDIPPDGVEREITKILKVE